MSGKKRWLYSFIPLIFCLICCPVFGQIVTESFMSPVSGSTISVVRSELLLRFRIGTSPSAQQVAFDSVGASVIDSIPEIAVMHLALSSSTPVSAAVAILQNNPDVEFVEPNIIMHAVQSTKIPNDPMFSLQWNMYQPTSDATHSAGADIKGPQAWNLFTGSTSTLIAIVDTGVDLTHPDLASNLFVNPSPGIYCPGPSDIHGCNFVANNGNPQDDNGHGSHVAGIAAAVTNNATGVAGVNWAAKLLAVKVLNATGAGSVSQVSFGIIYAANIGAKVINLSLGGPATSSEVSTLNSAISYAAGKGSFIVAAATNNGLDLLSDNNAYPARLPGVLAVGAFDSHLERSAFSDFGSKVAIYAPGGGTAGRCPSSFSSWQFSIRSTYLTSLGGYADLAGTSMAAPHVSGAMAMIFARFPIANNSQAQNILLNSADTVTFTDSSCTPYIARQLNLYKAMINPVPPAPVITSPSHPNPSVFYSNPNPIFNWTVPSDVFGISGYSYLLDQSSITIPPQTVGTTGTTASFSNLTTGIYYFHVRAVNSNGTWGVTGTFLINIDVTPPGPPLNMAVNGAPATGPIPWTDNPVFSVSWTNPTDISGIAGSFSQLDSFGANFSPISQFLPLNFTGQLTEGNNTLRIWLQDGAGNANSANDALANLRFDSQPPQLSSLVSPSTTSASPIAVGFSVFDPGAPTTGSGVANTVLWWRRDVNRNRVFGPWTQLSSLVSGGGAPSVNGTFTFIPDASDSNYQFYTQSTDIVGNSEPYPTSMTIPEAETFFDSTPAIISNITFPFISPTFAEINWTTDDQTMAYVDYGTSTSFGYRTNIDSLSYAHSASLTSLLYPAAIYYRITAINRTALVSMSPVASFNTPANVFIPTSVLGVVDTSQPITVQVNNPALTSAIVMIDGQTISLNLTASNTFQIFIDTTIVSAGNQIINVSIGGFNITEQVLVDASTRTVRLVRLVMDGGGVMTSTQGITGVSAFDSDNMLDMTMGQAVQGPASEQTATGYVNSDNSRLYLGYYSGIDPVAPGAVSNLIAVTGPATGQVTLSWTAPGNDAYVGQAMTYDLRLSTSLITNANFTQASPISLSTLPAVAGTAQSGVASGLSDSTTYYFALKTIDALMNVSTISNVAVGSTFQVAKSTDFTNGQPTVELISTVPGLQINIVSTTTTNPAVALATMAASAQGLLAISQIYDIITPINPLPSGGEIAFQFDPTGFSPGEQNSLGIYHFNATQNMWILLSSGVPLGQDVIFAPVTTLSFFAIMAPDRIPPVTTLTAVGGRQFENPDGILYVTTSAVIHLAAVDPPFGRLPGSGVNRTEYRIDNSISPFAPLNPSTQTIQLSAGLHEIQYRSVDNAGNTEITQSAAIGFDAAPPVIQLSAEDVPYDALPDGILILSSASITGGLPVLVVQALDPAVTGGSLDEGSGVTTMTYRLDGGPFNVAGSSFSVALQPGLHLLALIVSDNVGNTLDRSTTPFRVVVADIEPPRTTLAISSPEAPGGPAGSVFVSSLTIFNLSSIDDLTVVGDTMGLGVAFQELDIDGNLRSVFQNPNPAVGQTLVSTFTLAVDPDGIHYISYFAQDIVQNREFIHVATVAVDDTPPISTATMIGPQVAITNATPGVFGGPLFVATSTLIGLTSQDPVVNGVASGVNRILYGIDQPPANTFSTSFPVVNEGTHTINFLGIDNVGNAETPKQLNVTVDATPPVTTVSFFGPYLSSGPCNLASNCPPGIAGGQPASVQVFVASRTVVALSATDPISNGVASGVSVTRYRIDNGPWTAYGGAFGLGGEGVHTLQVQSQDRVLNAEAIQTFSIAVDQTPPVTTLTLGSPKLILFGLNVITSNSPISLSAVDPLSQGDAVGVSQISYRIDSGPLTIYSSPFTLPQGMHTIDYGAIDRVQNAEARKTLTVGVGNFITGGISGVSFVTGSGTVGITGLVESNGAVNLTGNTLVNGNVIAASVRTSGKAGVIGTITQGATPLVPEPVSIDAITQLAQASNANNSIPPGFLSAGILTISGGKSLTLATGTYVVQGLNISGGGSLIAKGAVDILVQGPVQISGGGQANISGPASNLAVFSGSSQGMNLSGGAQTVGIFYGPRGPLQVTGNAQIGGSLFAQSVTISGTVAFASGDALPPSPGKVAKADVDPPSTAMGSSIVGTGNLTADPTFTMQDLYAFPNPAVGGAKPTIHVAVGIADQVTIRIFDMSGRQVQQVMITDPPQVITDGSGPKYAYEYAWSGHIPTGTYLYTIEAQKGGASSIHKSGKFAVVR